jgi:NIMA (never in mitosis gene a)-related kinase 1/4/5
LGNERTVTFCKPSPEQNSINSIRSIKEYTTTQSVKELSIDGSQVDDEVTSKAVTTKTPGILRTPKSAPTKTFSARNRLDPPKTSYSRTNHNEVFDIVLALCFFMLC